MNRTQAQRLLDVATSLRDAARNDKFYMGRYVNICGTPACALGHYIARTDLQRLAHIEHKDQVVYNEKYQTYPDEPVTFDDEQILDWFGLDRNESRELFGGAGCGEASTPTQAAKYIEKFLDKKGWTVAA